MTEHKNEYRKMKCPHCGNFAPMEIRVNHSERQEHSTDSRYSFQSGQNYELLSCPACHDVVLRVCRWDDSMDSDPYDTQEPIYETLYPAGKRNPLGLPETIQTGLEAAEKVKRIDANAYGVLIRRVLEMVCIDREAKGTNLFEKLKNLAKSEEIPDKLVDVAYHLKDFGNVGAHPGLGNLTEAEVPILDDLCRAILEYVYSAPFLVQKAQDSLKAITKK